MLSLGVCELDTVEKQHLGNNPYTKVIAKRMMHF